MRCVICCGKLSKEPYQFCFSFRGAHIEGYACDSCQEHVCKEMYAIYQFHEVPHVQDDHTWRRL